MSSKQLETEIKITIPFKYAQRDQNMYKSNKTCKEFLCLEVLNVD